MSFASIFVIVACLIIMGCFALLSVNVSRIISDFESDNVILAYVEDYISESDARQLEPQIEAIPNVASAVFVSREEAYASFVGRYEDQSRFEGLDASVLRSRYTIYIDDIELMAQTQNDISLVSGIGDVNANLKIAAGFVAARRIVSTISLTLVVILFIVSLFIMSNTIRLATFERREEIAIMRMVGATSAFIRWPFVVEGFVLGLIGALLAFIAEWGIYAAVANKVISVTETGFIMLMPFRQAALWLCIANLAVGFGAGIIGSSMAIRKYLKV
jgi:cell division transport system permease protein